MLLSYSSHFPSLLRIRNQTFNIPVFDKETQFVELTVYDYDIGMAPDFLGKLTINLDTLPINDVKDMDLSLNEVDTGTIQLSCEFISFKKGKVNQENNVSNTKDELFYNFTQDALTTDNLEIEDGHHVNEQNPSPAGDSSGNTTSTINTNNEQNTSSSRVSRRGIGGLLTVTNIHGKNFRGHSLLTALKPYVIFTVGNTKHTTAVHRVTPDLQVIFDETFHITIQEPFKSTLVIKVGPVVSPPPPTLLVSMPLSCSHTLFLLI